MGSQFSPEQFINSPTPARSRRRRFPRKQRSEFSPEEFIGGDLDLAAPPLTEDQRRARALKTGIGVEEFAPAPGPPETEFKPQPLTGTQFLDELLGRVTGIGERLATATRPDPRIQAAIEEEERLGLPAGTGPLSQEAARDIFRTASETNPEQVEALEGTLADIVSITGAGKVLTLGRQLAGKTFFSTLEKLGPRGAQALARSIRGATEIGVIEAVLPSREAAVDVGKRLEGAAVGAAFGAALGPSFGLVGDLLAASVERIAATKAAQTFGTRIQVSRLTNEIEQKIRNAAPGEAQQIISDTVAATRKLQGDLAELLGDAGKLLDAEAETIARTGTLSAAAKEQARKLARAQGGAEVFKVSQKVIDEIRARAVGVTAASRAIANVARQTAVGAEERIQADLLLARSRQVQETVAELFLRARRSAGLTLRALQRPPQVTKALLDGGFQEMQAIIESVTAQGLQRLTGLGPAKRFIQDLRIAKQRNVGDPLNLVKDDFVALARLGVDYWRLNIFPLFSAGLDVLSNTAALGSVTTQNVATDLFDTIIRGEAGFYRSRGMLHGIFSRARVAEEIKRGYGRTAFGEKLAGTRREGILGRDLFSFMFPDRDGSTFVRVADRVSNALDPLISLPALTKGLVDDGFKRFGALSVLYEAALRQATRQGLEGPARTAFIRKVVSNPTKELVDAAVERARVTGFNRLLTDVEEKLSNSILVKAFVTPFPRWTFQVTRFIAEHSPVDPSFWPKVIKGTANSEDFVKFMTRNLEGVAALKFVDEVIYPHLDNFLQYRREDGAKIPLGFIEPIPQAVLILALVKGDSEMAFRALERASVFGMRIEGVFNVEALTNLYSKNPRVRQSAESRLDNMLDGFIPARGIRRAIETISDPGLVRGPLKNVPFFSQDGFPVIDPTTGEQRQAVVNILGSLRPDLGIPLLPRETNEVESEITRLRQFGAEGVGRRRPQLGARQEEALKRDGINPKSFVHRRTLEKFERLSGQLFFKQAVQLINHPEYPSLTLERKAALLNGLSARANRHARIMILSDMGLQPEPKAYTQTDAILRMLSGENSILQE